jgi:hypothetical protein
MPAFLLKYHKIEKKLSSQSKKSLAIFLILSDLSDFSIKRKYVNAHNDYVEKV